MRLLIPALILALAPFTDCIAAQTASARMFSLSARFSKGSEPIDLYSLGLSTIETSDNGELAPGGAGDEFECWSWLTLYDETYAFEPEYGYMDVNLPPFADVDGDGFHDFFNQDLACSGVSVGEYGFPYAGSGNVTARWSRGAGSKSGVCKLTLNLYSYPFEFTHTFEITDYRGTISYTPTMAGVSGMLSIALPGAPESLLAGFLSFDRDSGNPTNWLNLVAGTMTNLSAQTLQFNPQEFSRDPAWPTNYFGYMEFVDGSLETSEEDYKWLVLSIDDMNDTDSNGIPDFSDLPIRRAVLGLSRAESGLSLAISADPGTTWRIERSFSVMGGWTLVETVAINSDPQTVSITLPPETAFWRAVKQ